ncbi:MAG TPA: hypothetical protein VHE58_05855 [Burkholderiales bacterium]|nr:hypothetical protein [Burkholderiales bacterium]
MQKLPFKTSPLVIIAAVSVIISSLIGIAAIAGHIPSVSSKINEADAARAELQSGKPFVSSVVPLDAKSAPTQHLVEAVKACPNCGVIESITANQEKGDAYAVHEVEKNVNKKITYQVKVRMNNGTYRVVSQQDQPVFRVGEKVKIVNGTVVQFEKVRMMDKNLIFGLMLATLTSQVF